MSCCGMARHSKLCCAVVRRTGQLDLLEDVVCLLGQALRHNLGLRRKKARRGERKTKDVKARVKEGKQARMFELHREP